MWHWFFLKAKMVAILKMMDLQKKYSQKYIQQERMLDFKTLSCHFQIHHGPNIPMQQLHKHKFDEDMKVVLEFDLKNSHLPFLSSSWENILKGCPKQRGGFYWNTCSPRWASHISSSIAGFVASIVDSKVRQRELFRQQMGYATKIGGEYLDIWTFHQGNHDEDLWTAFCFGEASSDIFVFVFFSKPKKHETVNNCFFFTGFFFPNKKTQHREGCLVGGEKLCGHHG